MSQRHRGRAKARMLHLSDPRLSPTAVDLLYWRNVKQSGAVFSSVLLLLFSLTQFSVVSVGAYLALAALSATISFRIYKSVLQAVQKTDEGHPFKWVDGDFLGLHKRVWPSFLTPCLLTDPTWRWRSLYPRTRLANMLTKSCCIPTLVWKSYEGCSWYKIWWTPWRCVSHMTSSD